jgi:hypothetical protein
MRIIGHLIVTAFKTFWRIVFGAALCAAVGAGAVLAVAHQYTQVWWPPKGLTYLAMVSVAALAAYAGAVTVLMAASVKGLVGAARVVEREAVAPIKAVEQELEGSKR